jgi:glycerol-3-phosphate cytidylyltransferase
VGAYSENASCGPLIRSGPGRGVENMGTVLTYGTFDLFHVGHVRILRRLRELGDRLVVGLSTDEFNALKGKVATYPFEQRREILEACRYVDEVFPERSWEQKTTDIARVGATILGMGDDWVGRFDDLATSGVRVVYLRRTPAVSTTAVVAEIRNGD